MPRQEKEILEGIKRGDSLILKRVYRTNLPVIVRFVQQNSGNEKDGEDIFQEAMVLIFKKLKSDTLQLNCAFGTYLYAVCKNIWLSRLRKQRRMIIDSNLSKNAVDLGNDMLEAIVTNERHALYRKCFDQLSPKCQELLELYFQGTKPEEIAQKLNSSVS